ncbi:MAG: N-6 DNA methylase [Bacteroidetes bacterium]|nr:N-6 DNA methylase [Bacteroidota bacterium]
MGLFQKSVIAKYLKTQNNDIVNLKWKLFSSHFLNPKVQEEIKELKEEQYQGEFLEDLFVKILGYTKPASSAETKFNLTTEYKNIKDSKKADGAIIIDNKVVGVIELKGCNTTDLGKIEVQAFSYKNNQPDCVYVITSNFEKLRFYIDNAIEHIEFNLFTLTEEDFQLLYLCLAYDNISNNIAKKIKDESLSEEDVITKKLYKDYSVFKRELHQNLVQLNPEFDPLLLFKKSQKLLDRFLFLFFGEDRNLLPPNSVRLILSDWKELQERDVVIPLYDRFKKYFEYLNTGFKGKRYDVFAYNGGLFKPDEVLDNIKIDDELLFLHTAKLSDYDFASEVDVNILGHIFENSLNELDEIKAELEGTEIDKSKSKRKKDGVFYTPKYITKYIVENTIGKLCIDKKAELEIAEEVYFSDKKRTKQTKQPLLEKLETYRKWLLQLTICDPACGSGAFLNQALDFLIHEHRYVDELQAKLFGDALILSDIENSILENNLFGVDINEESVEIAKLSLWLRTAQPNRKLNDLNNNIKCGNSLIDDVEVAGDKSFNWQTSFPKVFEKGGFDVVIGNPPYVRAELFSDCIKYYQYKYYSFQPAADLFTYFYELGFSLLNNKGLFGFISNTFDKTKAAIALRDWLKTNTSLIKYIDFTDVQIFEGATTYPIIFIAKKHSQISSSFEYVKIIKGNEEGIEFYNPTFIEQVNLNKENWSFNDNKSIFLINKLQQNPLITKKYGKCYYGVKTALNEAFIIPKGQIKNDEYIKPFYEGYELSKWSNNEYKQSLILYKSKATKEKYGNLDEAAAFEKVKEATPDIIQHLLPFEHKAKNRSDKGDYWWELRNCAYYHLFEQPKIIFPNLQNSNKFSLDESGIYINAPAVMLSLAQLKNPISEGKFLLGIINSKLIWYYLKSICVVRSGGYIEVKPQYFEQIPIPDILEENQIHLIQKVDYILLNNNELQHLILKFQRTIQRKFEIEDLPNKLQNWYLLSYPDFIKELAKKKVKLTLSQEAEWEDYFNQESKKALELKANIDTTDKEIDKMVYELYGLTEEEIAIEEQR